MVLLCTYRHMIGNLFLIFIYPLTKFLIVLNFAYREEIKSILGSMKSSNFPFVFFSQFAVE